MTYSEYKNSFGSLSPYEYDGNVFSDNKKIYDFEEPNPGHEIWTDSNILLVKMWDLFKIYTLWMDKYPNNTDNLLKLTFKDIFFNKTGFSQT